MNYFMNNVSVLKLKNFYKKISEFSNVVVIDTKYRKKLLSENPKSYRIHSWVSFIRNNNF